MATIVPTTVEEQIRAAAYRWTDYSTADTSTPIKVLCKSLARLVGQLLRCKCLMMARTM
jgi:hypothetical protein